MLNPLPAPDLPVFGVDDSHPFAFALCTNVATATPAPTGALDQVALMLRFAAPSYFSPPFNHCSKSRFLLLMLP